MTQLMKASPGIRLSLGDVYQEPPTRMTRHNTLGGRAIDAIRQDLEFGNGEYDANYKRPVFVKVSKATATDSSFRLFGDELKKRQKIYNAVLFVVSHRAIFKYRARKTIKAAYEQRFYVSEKQKANLKG
ncbi:hypothetical protein HO133_001343 [Letharia lupina]|uniref:Uncharacterized protein n=1 Tax=Letharia lupina TaxID=560253 RepID=A0A8H6CEZ0_9LECA|nr:uncharacterized protein HO133_001343 [Letharia lupina]KAF6222257.1 hypothetical protein HO133_001343 [Letharia lupina]